MRAVAGDRRGGRGRGRGGASEVVAGPSAQSCRRRRLSSPRSGKAQPVPGSAEKPGPPPRELQVSERAGYGLGRGDDARGGPVGLSSGGGSIAEGGRRGRGRQGVATPLSRALPAAPTQTGHCLSRGCARDPGGWGDAGGGTGMGGAAWPGGSLLTCTRRTQVVSGP
ncbi:uncharacterized protein FLJ37310-like [Petaurus breviceps papuanus]|uniref:uncharacterized protein FLJ37310-like n=1 Tax=Petaurus breviceps papuanus TaxID=3040969 RepID=UPI0036DC8F21